MAIFGRKHNTLIINVTRTACGDDYVVPSNVDYRLQTEDDPKGTPIKAMNDKQIEALPEATAAMMIYGYCSLKYANQSKLEADLLKELLSSRGISKKQIEDYMFSGDTLFSLIDITLKYAGSPRVFSDDTLTMFYNNLCKRSPIFSGLL